MWPSGLGDKLQLFLSERVGSNPTICETVSKSETLCDGAVLGGLVVYLIVLYLHLLS